MSGHWQKFIGAAIGGALAVAMSIGSAAAASKSDNLEAERQRLFQQMLAQPDNLEVAFSYATLSVRVGDLEGAVSTLERMLIFSPGLPRIQFELGVLYYRLGNFDTAESYLRASIAGSNTPPDMTQRVEDYLEAIEKKLKRFRWSARTYFGLRWESNANSGPDSRSITLNGAPVLLNAGAARKSDFSAVITSRAHFEYDLHDQGDKLELDYVDFGAFHFDQTRYDAAISEVTFGPSFNLGRFEIDGTFLGIYGIANGAWLDDNVYFGTLGVGSRVVSQIDRKNRFVLSAEYRRQWFNNTARRATATDRNGNEYRVVGQYRHLFSRDLLGTFGARLSRKDRRVNVYDYWEFGGQVQFSMALTPTRKSYELPWVTTVRAGYLHRDFDTPDPAISATRTQDDDEFWVGGNVKVPLTKTWAVVPKVEYRQVNSNNPLRDFKAFSATIGVQFSQ